MKEKMSKDGNLKITNVLVWRQKPCKCLEMKNKDKNTLVR